MNGLADFYGQPYSMVDPQRAMDRYRQNEDMDAMDTSGGGSIDANINIMGQPQTLDQIINQNNQELMRRRSTTTTTTTAMTATTATMAMTTTRRTTTPPVPTPNPAIYQRSFRPQPNQDHVRRASMLEFSSSMNSDLADFQFDPNPAHSVMHALPMQKSLDPRRVRSREDLSLDTRFSRMNPHFEHGSHVTSYSPVVMSGSTVGMESSSGFMNPAMDLSMDFDPVTGNVTSMGMQPSSMAEPIFTTSPMTQSFPLTYPASIHDPGGGGGGGSSNSQPPRNMASMSQPAPVMHPPFAQKQQIRRNPSLPVPLSMNSTALPHSLPSPAPPGSRRQSMDAAPPPFSNHDLSVDQMVHIPPLPPNSQPPSTRYHNAYSSSGFDMLGVLMRVATRRKPEINIGPVDLSCSFVVCDLEKYDLPIVYCSEMFERLTGYTRHEILGRNCRFLQAPDGKVQSGVKRKYVDDRSVLYMKNQINKRAEAQLSLINYRKGGQPFMNLLTMIPIPWDTEDYRFYVGFQVDLVEQPSSVSGKNPDGTYSINYNRSALPAYALPPPPDPSAGLQDMGQTIPRDEVSQVLSTIGSGESELSTRIWDKVLLENTDDVVHVLSLKGLFLYLSPASRKVLEYDASELVGTALSAVCHPSDIVPVTRELKDSSGGAPVNVVYRIRRKHSGYTWFEAHGALHTEQGKGRKCIILVGRERPVYALDRNKISTDGGIGDSELWTKLSTSGMFLFVSSHSRAMLDRLPEDLVGTSMQALMRPESKKEFMRLLELARCGEKSTFKHDLQNRRGQVLQAQTTIYPGDARPGSKPTFLLAQTRLLKMTRALSLSQKSSVPASSRVDAVGSSAMTNHTGAAHRTSPTALFGQQSVSGDVGVLTQAGIHGLALGNQDEALASEDNIFDELKTTRSTSWQFELRQMERQNRLLAEELQGLLSRKKKRKRRKGLGQLEKDCANCHTRVTPEWRRGPSGNRDLCNSCGLRWAKQNGRVSPRKYSGHSDKGSTSPARISPGNASTSTATETTLQDRVTATSTSRHPAVDTDTLPGTMPPKIDEGEEPPHPTVLPT